MPNILPLNLVSMLGLLTRVSFLSLISSLQIVNYLNRSVILLRHCLIILEINPCYLALQAKSYYYDILKQQLLRSVDLKT
jgi:hypothetical protein